MFTDITYHWAENEIQLLVDWGQQFQTRHFKSEWKHKSSAGLSNYADIYNNATSEGSSGSSPDFDDEEDIDEYLDKAVKLY